MILIEVLDRAGVPYRASGHHHCTQGWIQLDCPFCSPRSNRFRLGYKIYGRYFSCWSCGYHSAGEVLPAALNISPREAWDIIDQMPMYDTPTGKFYPSGRLELPVCLAPLTQWHRDYLTSRNLEPSEIINLWKVKGIGQNGGDLRWSLFIPIHLHGYTVSWTTRKIGPGKPRYLTARDDQSTISPSNLLYGIDHVRQSVIVVEGSVDVWAIGQGSVAIMGSNPSPAQIEQLSRIPRRVICLDNEELAQVRARKLCADLSVYEGTTTNIILESGKDPADSSKREVEELRKIFLDDHLT